METKPTNTSLNVISFVGNDDLQTRSPLPLQLITQPHPSLTLGRAPLEEFQSDLP